MSDRHMTGLFHRTRFEREDTCTMLQRQRGRPKFDSSEATRNYVRNRKRSKRSVMTIYYGLHRNVRDNANLTSIV